MEFLNKFLKPKQNNKSTYVTLYIAFENNLHSCRQQYFKNICALKYMKRYKWCFSIYLAIISIKNPFFKAYNNLKKNLLILKTNQNKIWNCKDIKFRLTVATTKSTKIWWHIEIAVSHFLPNASIHIMTSFCCEAITE